MTKIYTKSGDQGDTSLLTGLRVRKYDAWVEAYGTVDELNATLGLCIAESQMVHSSALSELTQHLKLIQNRLFDMGSVLASGDQNVKGIFFSSDGAKELETYIDEWTTQLSPLREFILPGGTKLAAQLHIARTVCRRAERATIKAMDETLFNTAIVQYLNRLSDFLFVAARWANHALNVEDIVWKKSSA